MVRPRCDGMWHYCMPLRAPRLQSRGSKIRPPKLRACPPSHMTATARRIVCTHGGSAAGRPPACLTWNTA
eukprot:9973499-Alexandrium_andersonii.AAC.2